MEEKTTKKENKTLNVYQRLQNARVELQKMNIKKSGENKYSAFKYFELKDFIPPLNEIFLNCGLSSNFSIVGDIANLFIINIDNPDENILFTSPIAEVTLKGCTAIQAVGATHTYMKRYLYLNALEITEDDILDKEAGNIETKKKSEYSPKFVLFNKFKAKGLTKDQMNVFCQQHGISSSDDSSIQSFLRTGDIDKRIDDFLGSMEVENAG